MAVNLSGDVKVPFDMGNDTCVFVFPPFHSKKYTRNVGRLLKNRMIFQGAEMKDQALETRIEFFDETVIGVEGLEINDIEGSPIEVGPGMDLERVPPTEDGNKAQVWTDLVPLDWKVSICSVFEEKRVRTKRNAAGK